MRDAKAKPPLKPKPKPKPLHLKPKPPSTQIGQPRASTIYYALTPKLLRPKLTPKPQPLHPKPKPFDTQIRQCRRVDAGGKGKASV